MTRKERHAYRLGFASGVASQIDAALREREQLKTSTGTSLVLCKQALVAKHFAPANYHDSRNSFSGSNYSYHQGREAGKNASLNRQVGGQQQGRLT